MSTKLDLLGSAGELRIASELQLRGIRCYRPYSDHNNDLLTETGIRIQARTCNYHVNAHDGKKEYNSCAMKVDSPGTDFYIIWIIPTNNFYVIPASELRVNFIRIYPNSKKSYIQYRDAWHLLTKDFRKSLQV